MFAPLFKFITGAALAIVAIVGYLFSGVTPPPQPAPKPSTTTSTTAVAPPPSAQPSTEPSSTPQPEPSSPAQQPAGTSAEHTAKCGTRADPAATSGQRTAARQCWQSHRGLPSPYRACVRTLRG